MRVKIILENGHIRTSELLIKLTGKNSTCYHDGYHFARWQKVSPADRQMTSFSSKASSNSVTIDLQFAVRSARGFLQSNNDDLLCT